MRTNMFFGAAALGVAGVLLAAPAANATETRGSIGFDNNPARPGETVTIIGGCNAPGFTTAKVDSQGALDPVEVYLKHVGTPEVTLWGVTKVAKKAKPGDYTVSYMCGKVKVRTKFTVQGEIKPATPKPVADTPKPATSKPRPVGQVSVKPKGAADTGAGDIQNVASVQDTSGPATGALVLGGAAVVAIAGAGAFAFRRVRKEN
jgi:hypothetical protein